MNIVYEWESDSHFAELQDAHNDERTVRYVGSMIWDIEMKLLVNSFSQEYMSIRHILKLTQEEIDDMKEQIASKRS